MRKQDHEKKQIIDALRILMHLRWFWSVTILITGLLTNILPGIAGNANFPLFYMIIMFLVDPFIINGFGYYFIRRPLDSLSVRGLRLLATAQIALDYIIAITILYFAGGIMSIGFIWMVINMVAIAHIYTFWGVIATAVVASLMYVSLLTLQFFSIIPYNPRYNLPCETLLAHNPHSVVTNSWVVSSTFIIIAVFSALLARNLRYKENEILEERNKEEAILSNLIDGLVYIDKKDLIEMINPQAEKLLGFKATKVLGRNIHKIDYKKLITLEQVIKKDTTKSNNLVPYGKADRLYKIFSVNVKSEDGRKIGTAKLIHDISRERFIDKMKSEFIMIAGHQFRTPLSAIKNALHMVWSGDVGSINEKQRELLGQSIEYNERIIELLNDLLNVSSIEEGQFDYSYESTDIHILLREVCERFFQIAEEKKINFSLNILNNIAKVELDLEKIKLALGGIIDNAIRYTTTGGRVEVSSVFENDLLHISVDDTGIGIPHDMKEKIFSKFFRADNALLQATEGNGLDLYVAKNIIENHNGRIWFDSAENKGTTFHIELPLKQKK